MAVELGVGHYGVDHAHVRGFLCAVVEAHEEDLARLLLTHLPSEQRGPVAAVEARHVRIGLFEEGVLLACNRHVANDVEAVAATDRPARDHRDHDLLHEPDEPRQGA